MQKSIEIKMSVINKNAIFNGKSTVSQSNCQTEAEMVTEKCMT